MNEGDVVKLKSGGPMMTISQRVPGGRCYCRWFDVDQRVHHEMFQFAELVACEEAKT